MICTSLQSTLKSVVQSIQPKGHKWSMTGYHEAHAKIDNNTVCGLKQITHELVLRTTTSM